MIRERGLDGRVHWEGARLPWMQVREAYATHDALLFTSIRDSFGSQNLEAMSVGLPVISLRLGGARDFIPDAAGLKVEVGPTMRDTVNNFVDALNQFANMPVEERNRMSEAAWRGAQEFSWTRRAEVATALYAEARGKP
jgi:glycosyltransferase involved in cell wall biosynthesis